MRIFLILLILFFSKNLLSNSLFDSDFYEVNFKSNNIENDKLIKIRDIKFKSINKIFNNILIENDYKFIKRKIDENLINTFIKNIIIEDEKIINDNYYSKIKVNYNKNSIILFLRKLNLSYVENLPSQMLIIVFERNLLKETFLSKTDIHYEYLMNINNSFFKIPKLDINDKYLLSNININNNYIKNLDNIVEKYSSSNTILLLVDNKKNKIQYDIYLYSDNDLSNILSLEYSKYDFNNLFSNIEYSILNEWKIKNRIQNRDINKTYCEIRYYNLRELKEIRKYLNNVSIIKNINLKKISYKVNYYDILYYGNDNNLINLFKLNKLNLKFNNNICKISLK